MITFALQLSTAVNGFLRILVIVAIILASKHCSGEGYPYSWIAYSPNGKFVAVSVSSDPVNDQLERYRQNHPDASDADVETFARQLVEIKGAYFQSGVYDTGVNPSLLWQFDSSLPPGWVSSDGKRLAILGSSADDLMDFLVVRLIGPDNMSIDVFEHEVVGLWTDAASMISGSGYTRVDTVEPSASGETLSVRTNLGDTIELRFQDGRVVSSNAFQNAMKAMLGSVRGILILSILLIGIIAVTCYFLYRRQHTHVC